MTVRKPESQKEADVPSSMVGAILLVLLSVFVPQLMLMGDLPTSLPALPRTDREVLAFHERAATAPFPSFLDEAFDNAVRASLTGDPDQRVFTRRIFGSLLVDATQQDPTLRDRLREARLRRFLQAIDGTRPDPMASLAARHRLVGVSQEPFVTRAMLHAWFDFRWELLAAREALRGEQAALDGVLSRIPSAERVAVTSWVFNASCEALLGLRPNIVADGPTLERCHEARSDFLNVVPRVDASYPMNEARASLLVLHGMELLRVRNRYQLLAHPPDFTIVSDYNTRAQDAFDRAHLEFTQLHLAGTGGRRIARYMVGTQVAVQ